jgi:hypothetical protein
VAAGKIQALNDGLLSPVWGAEMQLFFSLVPGWLSMSVHDLIN